MRYEVLPERQARLQPLSERAMAERPHAEQQAARSSALTGGRARLVVASPTRHPASPPSPSPLRSPPHPRLAEQRRLDPALLFAALQVMPIEWKSARPRRPSRRPAAARRQGGLPGRRRPANSSARHLASPPRYQSSTTPAGVLRTSAKLWSRACCPARARVRVQTPVGGAAPHRDRLDGGASSAGRRTRRRSARSRARRDSASGARARACRESAVSPGTGGAATRA